MHVLEICRELHPQNISNMATLAVLDDGVHLLAVKGENWCHFLTHLK